MHIQDPRNLPNNPPLVVVSNTELLSTLHRMKQNQSNCANGRAGTEETLSRKRRAPASSGKWPASSGETRGGNMQDVQGSKRERERPHTAFKGKAPRRTPGSVELRTA